MKQIEPVIIGKERVPKSLNVSNREFLREQQ